jgi:putative copper export protein
MKEFILWAHVVLASFWVGGMLFLSLVVAPFIKNKPYRDEFFSEAVQRYSFYGTFVTLSLLLLTGVALAFLYHGGFRRTIYEKLFLIVIIFGVSLYHDLVAGPKAVEEVRYRKIARYIGLLNLVLAFLMVYLGVRIRSGY